MTLPKKNFPKHAVLRNCTTVTTAGYVTLLSVLVVSAIGSAIAVSLLLLGTGSARNSLAVQQSSQAREAADTCVEDALERLRSGTTGNFSDTLTIDNAICDFDVVNSGGENYTIESTATVGTIIRKSELTVDQLTPSINVASWQEVSTF